MHRSLWFLWGIGVIAAFFAAGWRWRIERNYQTVGLVVDGAEVRTLQALTGRPLPQLLSALRQAGATAIAIPAEQLRDWVLAGFVRGQEEGLVATDQHRLERVRLALQQQLGLSLTPIQKDEFLWRLPLPTQYLVNAPFFIGLDQDLAKVARQQRLAVVARLPNPPGLTDQGLIFWLKEVEQSGAFAVLFEGEEVFGYRTMLPAVVATLREKPWRIGILELVSQKGDSAVAAALSPKVIRVHSVSARELVNFTQPELVDRFTRAVRERNVRLCYVRIPFHIKGEPLTVACNYLADLRQSLERHGMLVGIPSAVVPVAMSLWLWFFIVVGAVATGVAFLCLFTPLSLRQQWGLTIIGVVIGVVLWLLHPLWAARLVALSVAIVVPVIALWLGMEQTLRSGTRFARAARGLILCLGFLVAGGLLQAAALFDHRFWLKVSEFAGVKVSQLLPFVLVLALIVSQWMDTVELPWQERIQIAQNNWQRFVAAPVQWGQAVGLLFLLLLVAYWLLRTGNEPGVGISPWELQLRAVLEDFLGVRPRFKEFLLGHPTLVLAFVFLTGTHLEARIGQWLMLPAVIGLASVMNTFSHAHTPLALSLLRTVHGIWLGVLLGLVLVGLIKWISATRDKAVRQHWSAAKSMPSQAGLGQG